MDNHGSMPLVLVRPDTLKENGRFSPAPQLYFNTVNGNLPFREDISTRNTGNNFIGEFVIIYPTFSTLKHGDLSQKSESEIAKSVSFDLMLFTLNCLL